MIEKQEYSKYEKYNEIIMNLDLIKEYVKSTLIYLKTNNIEIDKNEIIMYLSTVPEILAETKKEIKIEMWR